jgi:hypothetical protein
MRRAVILLAMLWAGPAVAEPKTQVFPLAASGLPDNLSQASAKLTKALAASINATVARVPIEDAAGLLECDAESSTCLTAVAKSVMAERLVFGSISYDSGKVKVTLTRFDPKPDRQQQTFELTGKTADALATDLVRVSAPLFGKARPEVKDVVEPKPKDDPEPRPKSSSVPGKVATSTWAIIGAGAIAAAAGAVMLVSAQSIKRDVENAPNESLEDLRRLQALENRGIQRTRIGDGLVIVGGVGMAVGIVLAFLQRRPTEAQPATISPTPTDGGMVLVLTVVR